MHDDDDEAFMGHALAAAARAAETEDVPVGAVIVDGTRVIAEACNRREADNDPTAHAEIVALRSAAAALGTWRVDLTMYVTQEPCPMCAGALVNARIKRLVYGCRNPKAGAIESLYAIATDARLNHRLDVCGGVREAECAALLTEFFAKLRR
jgi:tRNA(adenine34) deaminase